MSRSDSNVVATAKLEEFTEITRDNIDSFHFHGAADKYPLTALLALPNDERAGTILRGSREDQVSGLTTASSLIMAAAIGIAVGIGKYVIAIGVSVLCVLVLAVMRRLEKRIS